MSPKCLWTFRNNSDATPSFLHASLAATCTVPRGVGGGRSLLLPVCFYFSSNSPSPPFAKHLIHQKISKLVGFFLFHGTRSLFFSYHFLRCGNTPIDVSRVRLATNWRHCIMFLGFLSLWSTPTPQWVMRNFNTQTPRMCVTKYFSNL